MAPVDGCTRYRCFSPRRQWLPVVTLLAVVAALLLLAAHAPPGISYAIAGALALLCVDVFLVPIHVQLGSEGVTFRRLGWRQFVLYASIESVQVEQRAGLGTASGDGQTTSWTAYVIARFVLRDGTHIDVGTSVRELEPRGRHVLGSVEAFAGRDETATAMVGQVRAHLRATQEHAVNTSPIETELARGGRSVDAWLRDLSTFGEASGGTYRGAALDTEALWAVLENPVATPSARVGAAIVLRRVVASRDRSRVRAIVEHCSAPRLRVALETTLSEEDVGESARIDAIRKVRGREG